MANGGRWRWVTWLVLVVAVPAARAADVSGKAYRATVDDGNGCLTHLVVGGEELLESHVDVARGFYLFQNGRVDLGHVTDAGGGVVTAESDRAKVRYTIGPDHVTAEATNLTGQPMSFYVVLDKRVRAAADDHGDRRVAPTAADWHAATFYAARATLRVEGLDRVWGPWGEGSQVCEVVVPANGTRTITATPGVASADDGKWLAALAAANWTPGQPVEDGPVVVYSPRDWQVVQRQTAAAGTVRVSGRSREFGVTVQMTGTDASGKPLPPGGHHVPTVAGCFDTVLTVPAGGWYRVTVTQARPTSRPYNDLPVSVAVDHVGVGEVFVTAGQSNSTNSGQERTKPASGRVSSFSGTAWRPANDPQPGPHDRSTGGSPWPAFGDAMAARYHVPIGIAVTGHGGTSVKQWAPGDELFTWTETRIQQLGPGGFRAVLWHQGENDWGMSAAEYAERLTNVIRSSQRAAGWACPWFVARASYHNGHDDHDDAVRAGQVQVWRDGVALMGPDTDLLGPDFRDFGGKGIHFAPKGLAAHGQAWADTVAAYLDPVLAAER